MTLERLNQHLELKKDLIRANELLATLEAKASPGAQALTGMPHAPGVSDKVGDLAAELADLRSETERLEARVNAEEREVLAYIDTIRDFQTRTVFRLHFIRALTWPEVAEVLGGYNNADTVRQICYRQIAKDSDFAEEEAERRLSEAERRADEYEAGIRDSL